MKRSFSLLTIAVSLVMLVMVQEPVVVRSQATVTIRDLVGANAVVNDTPSDLAQAVGWIRDYHKWYWYEGTDDQFTNSDGPIAPAATSVPPASATVPPTATSTPVMPAVAAATPSAESGSSADRLANGGFESGLSGWNLPSWFASSVTADGSQPHSGAKSVRFQGKTAGPYVNQDVPATPGDKVEFSGWLNVPVRNSDMSVVVELVARHSANGDLKTFPVANLSSATNGWVPVNVTATMPDRTAFVRVQVRTPKLDGTAYLDDISLKIGGGSAPSPTATVTALPSSPTATAISATATATATVAPTDTPMPAATAAATNAPMPTATLGTPPESESLKNGGFESGLDSWFVPSWFMNVTSASGAVTHSGANALQFTGNSAGTFAYQEVPASPGQRVSFDGWVNIPVRQGDMTMIIELVARHQYNGDQGTYPLASFNTSSSGWVPVSGSAVMPARTASVRLQIRFTKLQGTAYLDDLSLSMDGSAAPSPTATATRPATSPTPNSSPTATRPPSSPTPIQPTATATQTGPTPTAGPTLPPAGGEVLANTSWPTYGQNALRNNRSPYSGPQSQPTRRWSFSRSQDHWGTDYRGVDMGENGTLYLAAGMAGVYAIDSASGQMRWLYSPDNTGHETWVEFPPTVSYDGKLYFASENDYIYALDPDGKKLWDFRAYHLHTPVSISPDGSTLHFISEDGNVYALDRSSGTLRWKFTMGNGLYATGRRIPVVYDSAGNLYFCWIDSAWSLTPGGQKRWSLKVPTRGSYMVGPAVSDDGTLVYTFSDTIYAIGMDGRLKWQYGLGKSGFDRTATIAADGTIYVGDEDGYVHALNSDGSLKWKQRYVTVSGWGGGVKSNILLDAAGTLYFLGKDQNVYAVSSITRQVLWKHSTGYEDNSYPGIQLCLGSDGTLYAPVDEGVLFALGGSDASGATATPAPTRTNTPVPTAGSTNTPVPTNTAGPTVTPLPTSQAGPTPAASGSVQYGAWVGSAVNVAGDEAGYEQATGKPRAIRHWYWSAAPISGTAASFTPWSSSTPTGAILMLSWAPSPVDSTLDNVNSGKHDAYITEWAQTIKGYGREVWLRPMWEDNGSWYWWNSGADWDTNKKGKYKAAFQRVVNLFRQEGATNVKFVWSPNVGGSGAGNPSLSYPGSTFVDWIGLDGYPMRGGRGDFYSTFKPDYDALGGLGKPLMVTETGISISSDADRANYVTNLLTHELPVRFPNFKAFVWFSEPGWGDLLDSKYPLTLDAFKKGIASPNYTGR